MKDATRKRKKSIVIQKGGTLKKWIKTNKGWDMIIECSSGSVFRKDYKKIDFSWCPYLCCNRGKKIKIDDKHGFSLFKKAINEGSSGSIQCISERAYIKKRDGSLNSNRWAHFRCNNCKYEWAEKCTTQLAPISSSGRQKGCASCAGQVNLHERREGILRKANLKLKNLNSCSEIKNNGQYIDLICEKECGEVINKSINRIDAYLKSGLGWCSCTRARIKWSADKIIEEARIRGFELISELNGTEEIKHNTILKWQCPKGHVTSFSSGSLKRNGCSTCYHEKRIDSINKLESFIIKQELPIELIPGQKWKTSLAKLTFKCNSCGIEFKKVPTSVVFAHQGCPDCSKKGRSNSEIYVHKYLEDVFKIKFEPNLKPFSWLVYNGNKLELDGFCEEHNIAFEHQGIQHYEYNEFFHAGDPNNFKIQQERDKAKKKLCEENGIKLIRVPALDVLLMKEGLDDFLRDTIIELDIKLIPNFNGD